MTIEVIKITDLNHQGEGVGRLQEGIAVFVPGALPGEQVEIEVTQRKKNYASGKLLGVMEASTERHQPQCSIYNGCGGCAFQHANYQAQLQYKRNLVQQNLTRIGKLETVTVLPTLGMKDPWHYRNKVHFQVQQVDGQLRLGYFAQGSHDFKPLTSESCGLVDKDLNQVASEIETILNKYKVPVFHWRSKKGLLRHVVLRKAQATGQIMVVFVTSNAHWPRVKQMAIEIQQQLPNVVSVIRNINQSSSRVVMGDKNITLAGESVIMDKLGDVKFAISPNSFYQVNPSQTSVLYQKALEDAGLTGQEKVLDAYSGIGTIALFAAKGAKEVVGLEMVPQAVQDAKENAARNGITNAEFYQGEVERLLLLMKQEGYQPDVVILDPPRKGCDQVALETLAAMQVPKIVYVSCNPATLARDVAYLHQQGYNVGPVQPVDMFPWTSHVECVILMQRRGSENKNKV